MIQFVALLKKAGPEAKNSLGQGTPELDFSCNLQLHEKNPILKYFGALVSVLHSRFIKIEFFFLQLDNTIKSCVSLTQSGF